MKNAIKHFNILLLFISIYSAKSFAQVKGLLQDDMQQPIQNASLFLNNGAQTQTNANGVFEFKGLMQGSYVLSIQIQEQLVKVTEFSLLDKDQNLALGTLTISKNIQLKEATITDKFVQRNIERMPEIRDNIIYSGKKNEVLRLSTGSANLAQNNSRQIFAKVPGVQVWESDGSGVQMGIATRGLSPNRMWEFNTRQNGYDIASDPFGYPEAYYTPSVESLDRIEVIRGAASLQFGPQYGGMVNYIKKQSISHKKVSVESVQTFGSNGLFSTFNAVGGKVGKFSYYANINYRKSDGWRVNNDYETVNGYIHLGYQINKKMKLSAEFTRMNQLVHQPGGLTEAQFLQDPKLSTRERNWFYLNWNIPALNFEYDIRTNQHVSIKIAGLTGDRNSIGNLNAINIPDTISTSTGMYGLRRIDQDAYRNLGAEIRYLNTYTLGKQKHHLAAGIKLYQGNTSRIRNNNGNRGKNYDLSAESNTRAIDQNFETGNVAFFAENLFKINQRWSITPGFRLENLTNSIQGSFGTNTISPTNSKRKFILLGIGSEYKIKANMQLYANMSEAYRPVLFSDLTPTATSDSIDQNLKDSKGYNADFGIRGSHKNMLTYDVSLFYMQYGNRIGTYSINSKNYKTNIGNSVSKGVEAFIEFTPTEWIENNKMGKLSLYTSLAFIDASYTTWNDPDPSKSLVGNEVENAPHQIHRIGLNYMYKKISTSFQWSSVSATFADAKNTTTPNATAQVGLIPSYQVLDWSFQIKLPHQLTLNGGINNIANTAYFTRRSGGYPGPGLLPAEGRTWYVGVGIKL